MECSAQGREAEEGRRSRRTDRSTVVGDRGFVGPGAASRCEATLEAGPTPTVASHLGDTAVLEYRPTETLPLLRPMLLDLARLCRPRRSPQPPHPRKTAASRRRKANSRERQVRT